MADDPYPLTTPRAGGFHKKLLDFADDHGRDADAIRDILWLGMAHSYLLSMELVVEQTRALLKSLPPSWNSANCRLGLDQWDPHLEWLEKSSKMLKIQIGPQYCETENAAQNSAVFRHGVEEYPVYAAIAAQGVKRRKNPKSDQSTVYLCAHVLFAQVMLLRRHTDRYGYETRKSPEFAKEFHVPLNKACQRIRYYISNPSDSLKKVPADLPPAELARWAADAIQRKEYVSDDHLYPLLGFLRNTWGFGPERRGKRGSGGHRGRSRTRLKVGIQQLDVGATREVLSPGDSDDPAYDWGIAERVELRSESATTDEENEDLDLDPEDVEGAESIFLSDFSCDETRRDIGALARIAKAKSRHVLLANQIFPWEYNGLTIQEVSGFLSAASSDLCALRGNGEAEWSTEDWSHAEAITAAMVMFWLGADTERLAEIYWLPDKNLLQSDEDGKYVLAYVGDAAAGAGEWWIRAVTPEYRTTPEIQADQIRPPAPFLLLPDLPNLGYFIAILKKRRKPPRKGRYSNHLFISESGDLSAGIKCWLKQRFDGQRITLAKLTNYMSQLLAAGTGDPTLATLITGNVHRLARVRLFYTATRGTTLAQAYKRVVDELLTRIYGSLERPNLYSTERRRVTDQAGVIGGRNCPTFDAVRSMVHAIQADLATGIRYVDRSGFIRFHNLLSLWTLQCFAYATTCRAIVTPLLPLSSVDSRRGLASLSDKDDEFAHKTRLIWIPDSVQRQMAAYERHLRMVEPQMRGWRNGRVYPVAYFLDPEGAFEEARPKVIERHLKPYLQVKPNTHRRFLRTELIERGCSPEVVDAFMGHWQTGEEPFGKYSSFSYEAYVVELKRFLLPLLDELGFLHLVSSRFAP